MQNSETYFAFNQSIFAERLEKMRKKKGLTQYEFCKEIGVSTKQYQNWEYGNGGKDCAPSINKAIRICEICDVSLDYLFGRSEYIGIDHAMIGKETGLSPLAVQELTERIDPNSPPITNIDLDKILTSSMYIEFMCSFARCVGVKEVVSQNERKIGELTKRIHDKNITMEEYNNMVGRMRELKDENKNYIETIYPALIHKSSRVYENMVDDICNMRPTYKSK